MGRLDIAETLKVLETVMILKDFMHVIEPGDYSSVMRLGGAMDLTFHDSSYVVVAAERSLVLVTDDERLTEKSRGLVIS